jgi:hypothetical protein
MRSAVFVAIRISGNTAHIPGTRVPERTAALGSYTNYCKSLPVGHQNGSATHR